MKEIVITSSVLIAVILLLRWLFRGKVSQKLIYAAWLLVALRLLIPIQFGQSAFSVTALTETIEQQSKPIQQVQEVLDEPVAGPSRAELYEQLLQDYLRQEPVQQEQITPQVQQQIQQQVEAQITAPTLAEVLRSLWIAGIAAMAVWFIAANLIYLRRARQGAVPFTAGEAPVAVRVSPNVPTPCLVGFFRPLIYLTAESTEDPQSLNHVLTHELTHLRHWDHIWALVRCICLCVYWFNPLVWVAAHRSRRDCELACDESALKKLGDDQRIAYGKTLLATVTQSVSPSHLIETATAMNETKKQLKERVNFIVKKPRTVLIAAVCVILIAAITAGCAFAGSNATDPAVENDPVPSAPVTEPTGDPSPEDPTNPTNPTEPTGPDTPAEPIEPERLFEDPAGWYRMALTSEYEDPKDLDLAKFFANGFPEETNAPTDAEWQLLKDVAGFEKNDNFRRLPVTRMNEVLTTVFGLTLEEMNGVGLKKMTYLESTGCYYFMAASEANVPQFKVDKTLPGGIVYYTSGTQHFRVDVATGSQGDGYTYHIRLHWMQLEDTILQTTALAKEYLGLSRLEFLYVGNQIVEKHLMSGELDEAVKQAAKDKIKWDAHAINSRALYLDDGTLMMRFKYTALATKDDPLYGTFRIPVDTAQWEKPEDLQKQSYGWLFEMGNHVDGFVADAYSTVLLDALFREPDVFVRYLAEYDEESIGLYRDRLCYGILNQEEADLYGQLLAAVSARENLTGKQKRTLELLAQVPEWFPYEFSTPVIKPTEPAPTPSAHTHSYSAVVTEPTCTAAGYTTYTCTCGHSYTADKVAAKGHDFFSKKVAPTCKTAGYDLSVCLCGLSIKGKQIPAYGHTFFTRVTKPTCTEEGYTTRACSLCGEGSTYDHVPATGHDWGEWTVTREQTASASGIKSRTCKNCDATQSVYLSGQEDFPEEEI